MALVRKPSSQEILQSQCTAIEPGGMSRSSSPCESLSKFEILITIHQPVLESLLLQLPTSAILDLYHTSRYLRSFLQACPLAWNALSFRKVSTARTVERQHSSASDSSSEASTSRSKPYALDQLLLSIVLPLGICIKSLDLDHTAVSGHTLTSSILPARRETLQHLSVRGCKNVSLKYHIVPYLNLFKLQKSFKTTNSSARTDRLALKSLYTFRCAHHRRRPYLATSLRRSDSDAKATHEFILLCHSLNIWIDTTWCPTPGGRCSRRKQYFSVKRMSDLQTEVWVVFDRLWRSRNQIGSLKPEEPSTMRLRGKVWEDEDYGYDGEALGTGAHSCATPGKLTPSHLRRSHTIFVENHICQGCGDQIPERCEQCSIKMHCMGCRKTFCASCAYAKTLPGLQSSLETSNPKEKDIRIRELFWWAPNARRNPNLMNQENADGTSSTAEPVAIPSIRTSWCCVRPQFSPGGRITSFQSNLTLEQGEYICTVPLPPGKGFEDPDFHTPKQASDANIHSSRGPEKGLQNNYDPMLYWLLLSSRSGPWSTCPRNVCNECLQTRGWKVMCRACQEPICLAHDLRALQTRVCGYRDLTVEGTIVKDRMLHAAQEDLKSKHAQSEVMDRITTYMQEHGTLDAQLEYELAVMTELPAGDDDDLQEHQDRTVDHPPWPSTNDGGTPTDAFAALPFQPRPFNHSNGPLNTVNAWRGCASFFCQEFRPLGDHRRQCSASMKKCTECRVHVCFDCWTKQLPCDCSYCSDNYHCPNCFPKSGSENCKKAEELGRREQEEVGAERL